MDPKMLLGPLSTAAYAKPFVSDLEREFRQIAVPADPSHGLRANLATASLCPTPSQHRLSIDDDALLQSVTSSRLLSKQTPDTSSHLRRSTISGFPSVSRSLEVSSAPSAPWMRRMGYDEYLTQKTVRPSSSSAQRSKPPIKSESMLTDPKFKERRRNQILSTFGGAKKKPVYPDVRKGHLTPVKIVPIFPDLSSLLNNYIAVEFDRDETLTFESRKKTDPLAAKQSIQSMATISVAEPESSERTINELPKKFVACYTPTDYTLEQRNRKRRRSQEAETDEGSDDDSVPATKKINYMEKEIYEWFSEYSIREGKFGGESMSRSCFAVNEVEGKEENNVITLARVATSWKLARRPVLENVHRLGKEGLEISREFSRNPVSNNDDALKVILGSVKVKKEKKENLTSAIEIN